MILFLDSFNFKYRTFLLQASSFLPRMHLSPENRPLKSLLKDKDVVGWGNDMWEWFWELGGGVTGRSPVLCWKTGIPVLIKQTNVNLCIKRDKWSWKEKPGKPSQPSPKILRDQPHSLRHLVCDGAHKMLLEFPTSLSTAREAKAFLLLNKAFFDSQHRCFLKLQNQLNFPGHLQEGGVCVSKKSR